MTEQRILRASTDTLRTYPRVLVDEAFVPMLFDAVQVRVGTPAATIPDEDTWTNADIDPINAVITADASEGDLELAVAEVWVKGRHYLVDVDADGEEQIEVIARNGGTPAASLMLAEPLVRDVALGGAVHGWQVSTPLTAAQTDLVGNGLAMWKGMKDGVDYAWSQAFRIVRRLPSISLSVPELLERWPSVLSLRNRNDVSLENLIDAAWDDDIEDLLAKKDVDAEDVIADAGLKSLWALACVRRLVLLATNVSDRVKDDVAKLWQQKAIEVEGRNDWYDAPQDADPSPRPPGPPPIRTGIRLRR